MKIETVGINQNVYAPGGHVGRVVEISQNGQVHLDFGPNNFHYAPFFVGDLAPVSDPCQCAKGDKVRAIGPSLYNVGVVGKTFEVIDPDYHSADDGQVVMVTGNYLIKPENLVKCDPCEGCQKLAESYREGRKDEWRDNRQRIAELRRSRDEWEATAYRYCRNAAYWREELTKLQKEALAECDENHIHPAIHIEDFRKRPLSEVAKCYIRVAPEKLLMSREARRIIEILRAWDCPASLRSLAEFVGSIPGVVDGLIEAREAGIVRLDDGKYSIVGD